MPGFFLVLEGIDGSGKSSMADELRRHLAVRGKKAIGVRDPGGTEIGDKIRHLLLDPAHTAMAPRTELFLYLASRAQLIAEVILPALQQGKIVIADRFHVSTLVYQGVAGQIPENDLRDLVFRGLGGVVPDHVILFDVPVEIALARIGSQRDRMERKGRLFFEEVRQRYLGWADGEPEEKCTVIDASQPILEVTREVLEIVDGLLP